MAILLNKNATYRNNKIDKIIEKYNLENRTELIRIKWILLPQNLKNVYSFENDKTVEDCIERNFYDDQKWNYSKM